MLSEQQQKKAVVVGDPGDGANALRPLLMAKSLAGIGYADLDESQRKLVAGVMRTLISPFRKEDGDEVMQLINMPRVTPTRSLC